MRVYFITISAQQKNTYVSQQELDEVLEWLQYNGVTIIHHVYEDSGHYRQLHIHAIVKYGGRWKPFISYGDLSYTNHTFRIQWVKAKPCHTSYISKQVDHPIKQLQVLQENYYRWNYNPFWPNN